MDNQEPTEEAMNEAYNDNEDMSENNDDMSDTDGFETVKRSGRMGGSSMDDGGEPDFRDPEGYVDDVDEEELLGDLLQQRPKESDGMDSVIVVDGIPTVAAERIDKLKGVVRKIYSKVRSYHLFY